METASYNKGVPQNDGTCGEQSTIEKEVTPMKKRSYRSVNVKKVDVERLAEAVRDERIVFSVDIGKERVLGAVTVASTQDVKLIMSWRHPEQTLEVVDLVSGLPVVEVEAALEPSGTYGDALRWQLAQCGIGVHRVSPKRCHDAAEVYDGVPSSHDPKSSVLIGTLHLHGVSEPWQVRPEDERDLAAAIGIMQMFDKQEHANLNRLEARVSRHWPELPQGLGLKRRTVLELIKEFGSPQAVAAQEQTAQHLMRRIGGSLLKEEKIDNVLESARTTIGMPPTQVETVAMQELAAEILRSRAKGREAKAAVEKMVQGLRPAQRMAPVIGKTTAAVLVSKVGDPTRYESAGSFVKALGLNLKERSSGKLQGQLKITKRGPGLCRFYLYLAAMRLIMWDPVVKLWYKRKVARQAGKMKNKAVVAVMRKLAAALWHVARGEVFDSTKLFDAVRLGYQPANAEPSKPPVDQKVAVGQVQSIADFNRAVEAVFEASLT
jgi:hypothetical protein